MAREINLVPDIKTDMIKALKLRNLIFFICIVVSISSIAVTAVFGSIVGAQGVALNDKTNVLQQMSKAVHDYDDLDDFLTIQNQVGRINYVANNRTLLSRIFNIISTFQPTNGDKIEISEMNLNLAESVLTIEAQADAKDVKGIDYNVLESFKKSMDYLSYDYGEYVDEDGQEIPSFCIVEKNLDGTFFTDDGKFYAYWLVDREGCNLLDDPTKKIDDKKYAFEEYESERAVKIWRTPLYDQWYKEGKITLNGEISGVPHFESQCITYEGIEKTNKINWTKNTDTCKLVPDGVDGGGIVITESSDGLNADNELVLRFVAVITYDKNVMKASNHHVVALGPSGVYNVTDSYTQIQSMFSERAADYIVEGN